MSRKYLPVNREKPMFLPLDMRSWVPKDHFVWFLVDVAGQLDTSALQAGTSPGKGRPGYDPQMLATLMMYAMSCGVRSSREIEDRTRVDAGFRIASANQSPDHSTLCRFRQRTGGEDGPLEALFTQVLWVCAAAGLGRLRVISAAGSKIWADASKEANRTLEGLRKLSRKVLEEAARADGDDDCDCAGHGHGEAAGGEGGDGCGCCDGGMLPGLGLCGPVVLPAGWGGASRAGRIAAALADLESVLAAEQAARRAAAEAYLAKVRAGEAPPGRIPQEAAVAVAEIALEQAIAAQQAKRDAYDQRVAASARLRRSAAPGPSRRSRPRRCSAAPDGWPRPARPRRPGRPPEPARTRRPARETRRGRRSLFNHLCERGQVIPV